MVTHAPECAARASRQIHLLDGKVVDLEAPAAGERARAAGLAPASRRRSPEEGRRCCSTTCASPGRACSATASLSALIVAGIALGIALSTTFAAVRHAFAQDPIPQKSGVLHYVRLDCWDPLKAYPANGPTLPPTQITYRDMVEIMKSEDPRAAERDVQDDASTSSRTRRSARPFKEMIRLCFADFFPMFDVPFRYGSGWDAKADADAEPVVVLSKEMNEKLFGGGNSVGKTVRLEDRDFRVVGVLDALDAERQVLRPDAELRSARPRTSSFRSTS